MSRTANVVPTMFIRAQGVEDQLLSALLQIEKSSAYLPPRQGCNFALHVEAHEEGRGERDNISEV